MINRNDRNYNYNNSLGMKLQNHSEILSDEVKKCFFWNGSLTKTDSRLYSLYILLLDIPNVF